MTSVLSKFLNMEWVLTYNCYEVGHTWTPHCSHAAYDLGASCFREALKMYTGLYLFNLIASKKYDREHILQAFQSIMRSSAFLGFNAFSVMSIFCGSRQLLGAFYFALVAHIPAIIGSYLSILLERPVRRPALAFYVANVASETVYKKLVNKGFIKPLPHGEIVLFTLAAASLLYLIKRNGYGNDPVSFALKLLIGKENVMKRELNERFPATIDSAGSTCIGEYDSGKQVGLESITSHTTLELDAAISPHDGQHASCHHKDEPCLRYALTALARNFLAGYVAHSLAGCVLRPKRFLLNPVETLVSAFTNRKHLNFGAFIGLFSSIYIGANCVLRRASNGEKAWHGLVSGLLAGPSMFFYPNVTISQYLLWKCIETTYFLGVKSGKVKHVDLTMNVLYAMSTAQLFYVAVMEPRIMRPSYMKFLNRVTDDCFSRLNRNIIDVFGTHSSSGYRIFYPELDFDYTSNKFKESVLVWLI